MSCCWTHPNGRSLEHWMYDKLGKLSILKVLTSIQFSNYLPRWYFGYAYSKSHSTILATHNNKQESKQVFGWLLMKMKTFLIPNKKVNAWQRESVTGRVTEWVSEWVSEWVRVNIACTSKTLGMNTTIICKIKSLGHVDKVFDVVDFFHFSVYF